MNWVIRILKSFFALPVWVIIWIMFFLVPVNFAGLLFMETTSGLWICLLGLGGIAINLVIVWMNGGFSKVMAIPHIVLWAPLVALLGYRLLAVDMLAGEYWLTLAAFIINGISLFFDFYDVKQWRNGNRKITGFENEAVRF